MPRAAFTADAIAVFVRRCVAGDAAPLLRGQAVAPLTGAATQPGTIRTVVSATLERDVLAADVSVLLLVTTPWAGHGAVGLRIMAALADFYAVNATLRFAVIDASRNEHPALPAHYDAFPSALFSPRCAAAAAAPGGTPGGTPGGSHETIPAATHALQRVEVDRRSGETWKSVVSFLEKEEAACRAREALIKSSAPREREAAEARERDLRRAGEREAATRAVRERERDEREARERQVQAHAARERGEQARAAESTERRGGLVDMVKEPRRPY